MPDPRITAERYLRVTHEVASDGWLRRPTVEDRLFCFIRELVWQSDRGIQSPNVAEQEEWEYPLYLWAASGCAADTEMIEFWDMAKQQGWEHSKFGPERLAGEPWHAQISLHARLWVEEQTRMQGTGKQGFVAMWFDPLMDSTYDRGFKRGIEQAGYKPYRVKDDRNHSNKIDDLIMAEIRRSRFVVADFTCGQVEDRKGNPAYIPRASVYFEAGFAQGLGIPVVYTCREDFMDCLAFDTRQINHMEWVDKEDLARKLKDRLEGQFGRGSEQSEK